MLLLGSMPTGRVCSRERWPIWCVDKVNLCTMPQVALVLVEVFTLGVGIWTPVLKGEVAPRR